MIFTIEEFKAAIKARMADPKPPCDNNECEECKLCILLDEDEGLNSMFLKAFMQIEQDPKSIIPYCVAYMQLGMQIQEARQMTEMFK